MFSFKFSGENVATIAATLDPTLVDPKDPGPNRPTGAAGDTPVATNGSPYEMHYTSEEKEKINSEFSVIKKNASTWPFWLFRWVECGCYRQVRFLGLNIYRMTLSRAYWIWLVNLFCFFAHLTMLYLVATSCNAYRFGTAINSNCTSHGMNVPIFRLQANWTSRAADGYNSGLVTNGMPVNFQVLTAWFFGLSALFHSFPVFFGSFDISINYYWKQIDCAFCPWRWIEYTLSASVMFLALQLAIGLREQNALALSFVLMAGTMLCGLLTEFVSRPAAREDDGYRGWVGDPVRSEELKAAWAKKQSIDHLNDKVAPPPRYNPYYEYTPYQSRRIYMTLYEAKLIQKYQRDYFRNYCRRMAPHALGIFLYVAPWVVFVNHFYTSLSDLRVRDEALFARVPPWVPIAILGTVLVFSCFTITQIVFQYRSPDDYWRTEVIYCLLSLTAKMYLGLLIYVNVLGYASFEEGLAQL